MVFASISKHTKSVSLFASTSSRQIFLASSEHSKNTAAVEETFKPISNCGFSYFTWRDSYYDVPEGMFRFEERRRSLALWQARKGSKEDVVKNRHWATTHGDSLRQLSIRTKSTKNNPGNLPISAYGRRTLPNNPVALEDLTEKMQEKSARNKGDQENVVGRDESVEQKDEVILINKSERISGPLLSGKLAQTPKRTATKVKTQVYASDPIDCLALNSEFSALVDRRNIIETCSFETKTSISIWTKTNMKNFSTAYGLSNKAKQMKGTLNRNTILESGEPPLEELKGFTIVFIKSTAISCKIPFSSPLVKLKSCYCKPAYSIKPNKLKELYKVTLFL